MELIPSSIGDKKYVCHEHMELVLEITQFCPQKCIFCSSNAGPEQISHLNMDTIFHIINDAKSLGIRSIHLSGGEPLCHPNIKEILKIISENHLNIVLYTCGIFAIDGKISPIPHDLIDLMATLDNFTLRFNFQSSVKRNFERITYLKGSYDVAIQSLRLCYDAHIQLEAHLVPTLLNMKDLGHTIELLLSSGVQKVKILRFVPQGRGKINRNQVDPELQREELQKELTSIRENFSPKQVEIGSAFSCWSNAQDRCTAGIKKFVITPKNKLAPCVALKSTFGIKLRNNSLYETIMASDYKDSLVKLSEQKCVNCALKSKCTEICPVQKLRCIFFQLKDNMEKIQGNINKRKHKPIPEGETEYEFGPIQAN